MPTVDDLVVSVRIDETSNLGNLQKQLTALVGKKGDQKIDITSFDTSLKRELLNIKTELSYISAQSVPELENTKALSESLHRDRKVLLRNFDSIADRLISERTDPLTAQLSEYGVEKRPELFEKMKDVLSNFIGMMELGALEKLPGKVMQKIAVVSKELIAKKDISEGDRKTLISKMEKAIGELNTMFSEVLTKAGIAHKPEFTLYQFKESWYKRLGLNKDDIGIDLEKLLGSNTEVVTEYDKIKDLVPEGGLYDFIEASLKKLKISPTEETFTAKGIKGEPGLMAIATGILQRAWGTKAGIPTGFHDVIRKMLADLGLDTKELYERGRPDFLLLDNKIEDLKKVFPPDVAKALNRLVSFVELKSVLSESNKEQFKWYKDMVGKDFLVGIAALVKSSFGEYFPDIKSAQVNIVSLLKKFDPVKFGSEHRRAEMSKERMEEIQEEVYTEERAEIEAEEIEAQEQKEEKANELEKLEEEGEADLNEIVGILEDLDDISEDIKEITGESTGEITRAQLEENRQLEELKKAMDELKKVADDTNSEVKKEDINNDPPREGD